MAHTKQPRGPCDNRSKTLPRKRNDTRERSHALLFFFGENARVLRLRWLFSWQIELLYDGYHIFMSVACCFIIRTIELLVGLKCWLKPGVRKELLTKINNCCPICAKERRNCKHIEEIQQAEKLSRPL